LLTWLFRWPLGVDMWCQSCRPEVQVQIRRRVCEKIRRISNLLKNIEVRTLSKSNANFVTSLLPTCMCITDRDLCLIFRRSFLCCVLLGRLLRLRLSTRPVTACSADLTLCTRTIHHLKQVSTGSLSCMCG